MSISADPSFSQQPRGDGVTSDDDVNSQVLELAVTSNLHVTRHQFAAWDPNGSWK